MVESTKEILPQLDAFAIDTKEHFNVRRFSTPFLSAEG
jgi:hypothetical protein